MISTMRPPGAYRDGLEALIKDLPEAFSMVEVGCYAGESTEMFAEKALHVWAVDKWENGFEAKSADNENMEEVEASFDQRLRPYVDQGVVEKIKKDSVAASRMFRNECLDFVYLDGDHTYEGVMADLKAWAPKIKRYGCIGGHDFTDPNWGGEVSKAVEDYFEKHDLGAVTMTMYSDSSWMMQRVTHAEAVRLAETQR